MSVKPVADSARLEWIKSSYSTPDGAACIEVAAAPGTVRIRDSKLLHGPQLAFGPRQWADFVSYAADR